MANWVTGNLEYAINTWNSKLNEIYTLVTQSPETFRDGKIWEVIVNIHGAIQSIALALLVVFFVVRNNENLSEILQKSRNPNMP